jgi:4-aminobutyrate aminotransferase-like enzyme
MVLVVVVVVPATSFVVVATVLSAVFPGADVFCAHAGADAISAAAAIVRDIVMRISVILLC